MEGVLEQLRRAIRRSEKSRYALARMSGVTESSLCRFVNKQTKLDVGTVAKVADALGLELVLRPKRRPGKAR